MCPPLPLWSVTFRRWQSGNNSTLFRSHSLDGPLLIPLWSRKCKHAQTSNKPFDPCELVEKPLFTPALRVQIKNKSHIQERTDDEFTRENRSSGFWSGGGGGVVGAMSGPGNCIIDDGLRMEFFFALSHGSMDRRGTCATECLRRMFVVVAITAVSRTGNSQDRREFLCALARCPDKL